MASPQFDFFPRDFLAATIGWPAAARGHYITLLCVQWEQGGLPGDPARLDGISPGILIEWPEFGEKFPLSEDGKRRNPRLEKERAYREGRSAAGKVAAMARWGKSVASGSADVCDSQCQSHTESHTESHMRSHMRQDCGESESAQFRTRETGLRTSDAESGNASNAGETLFGCESQCESHMRSHMRNGMRNRCPPSPSPSLVSSSLRSEEIQTPSLRSGDAPTETPAARRSRSKPSDPIAWSPAGGWVGITDADRAGWRVAYPAVDLVRQLAAMGEWLRANPEKARKSRWRAFIVRWLGREQERGGGMPSNRPGQGDRPPAAITSRRWRDDALANMTDAQHAAWVMAQRPRQEPQEAARRANRPSGDTGAGPAPIGRLIESGGHSGESDDGEEYEHDFDPVRDGWVGKDGRP